MIAKLKERIRQAKLDGRFIQTSRLILIPLDVSDAAEAFKWCSDPDVNTYMIYTLYKSVDEVEKWIASSGHNCFGIFLRENGKLIGSGDVHLGDDDIYQLGYNLAKEYWGKGYATEASKALLAYRVEQGVRDFACEHAIDNIRSRRVIQKSGFVDPVESSYACIDGVRAFKSFKYALNIDRHEMNIDGKWFDKIVNGCKTIELRLNDDKRRCIKQGDYIILNNLDNTSEFSKIVVKVQYLHKYDSFSELYHDLDMTKCGYSQCDVPDPDDMLIYYSAERQAEWGVVGIEFDLLAIL